MNLKSFFAKKPQKKLPFKKDFSLGNFVSKLCSSIRSNEFLTDFSFVIASPVILVSTLYALSVAENFKPGQVENIPFWLLTKDSNYLLESADTIKLVPWVFAATGLVVLFICARLFKYSKHLTRFVAISTAISLIMFSLGFANLIKLIS